MNIDGSCHCGFLTYRAVVDPAKVEICHCSDCQKLSGSAFRVIVPAEPGTFRRVTGLPKTYVKTAESGNKREQGFCGNCGTPLYATSAGAGPKTYGLRVGSIRQRGELVPKVQYWTRSAQPWVGSIGDLPKVEKE